MDKAKLHRKPSKEELDEKIDASIKALETTPEVPTDTTPEEPKEEPEVIEDESPEVPDEEHQELPNVEEPETPQEPEVDYKKRYENSSREGILQFEKGKKLAEVIEKASQVPEPTEEELTKEYPDWEVMSDFERKMAKKTFINDRKFEAIDEATKEFRDMDTWDKKVDEFLADPKVITSHPALDGKEEDFRVFATKASRRGADFDDLISAYLYTQSQTVRPKHKGAMFETGSAGLNDKAKPKGDKITVEESRRLRISDYKKYLQYVRDGKIDDSEL